MFDATTSTNTPFATWLKSAYPTTTPAMSRRIARAPGTPEVTGTGVALAAPPAVPVAAAAGVAAVDVVAAPGDVAGEAAAGLVAAAGFVAAAGAVVAADLGAAVGLGAFDPVQAVSTTAADVVAARARRYVRLLKGRCSR